MSSPLILVVDDDAAIVNLLREDFLAEGFEVVIGYDGQQAIDLATSRKPRLIVIDMNMPGFTGLEALQRLREADPARQTPAILLTGESAQTISAQGLPAGIVSEEKPIDLDRLNSLVRQTLQKYPA